MPPPRIIGDPGGGSGGGGTSIAVSGPGAAAVVLRGDVELLVADGMVLIVYPEQRRAEVRSSWARAFLSGAFGG